MKTANSTQCSFPPCDTGPGEPCSRHERELAHAEGEHAFCGNECSATTTAPLTPEREAEYRAAVSDLDSDRTLSLGTWTASPVNEKSVFPPDLAHVVEDVMRTKHSVLRASVGVFGDERHAKFTAMAREALSALLAELDRVRAEQRAVTEEIARFGIYGSATAAARALVRRASELVEENARLLAERHTTNDALADITLARYVDADVLRVEIASAQRQWEHWAREATALRERVAELEELKNQIPEELEANGFYRAAGHLRRKFTSPEGGDR